jgi:hypothetical protein
MGRTNGRRLKTRLAHLLTHSRPKRTVAVAACCAAHTPMPLQRAPESHRRSNGGIGLMAVADLSALLLSCHDSYCGRSVHTAV